MRTKISILTVCIFVSIQGIGQDETSKQQATDRLDFRIGAGASLLGSGDFLVFNYENELNFKYNKYFTSSLSLNLGQSAVSSAFEKASFVQGNLNVFVSPFKNTGRFDFRVGTGITFYSLSETLPSRLVNENGVWVRRDNLVDRRSSLGYNLIIEGNHMVSDRISIGWKLFAQPYRNGDINSGVLVKLGLKL